MKNITNAQIKGYFNKKYWAWTKCHYDRYSPFMEENHLAEQLKKKFRKLKLYKNPKYR
jgi:hypothetical protein